MKYSELMKVARGVVLTVGKELFKVDRIQRYKCRTDSWLNHVFITPAGEWVLELEDGKIREWKQILDLHGVTPKVKVVRYRDRRWKWDESTRANVIVETAEGMIKEPSLTSVYIDPQDDTVLLSIETRGNKFFVWYSDRVISPRDIKVAS